MSPELEVRIGNEEMTLDNKNTRIQTYFGEIALYNNVVITKGEDEDSEAIVIFRTNPTFEKIMARLLELGFPAYLNIPEVSEGVVSAYLSQFNSDLDDYVPDSWT